MLWKLLNIFGCSCVHFLYANRNAFYGFLYTRHAFAAHTHTHVPPEQRRPMQAHLTNSFQVNEIARCVRKKIWIASAWFNICGIYECGKILWARTTNCIKYVWLLSLAGASMEQTIVSLECSFTFQRCDAFISLKFFVGGFFCVRVLASNRCLKCIHFRASIRCIWPSQMLRSFIHTVLILFCVCFQRGFIATVFFWGGFRLLSTHSCWVFEMWIFFQYQSYAF